MPINWFWQKFYRVRCPDGSMRIVYKNIDDTCPLHIPGWKADLAAKVTGLSDLSGEARAKYETHIAGLLYSLDEMNNSLMMHFRSIYLVFTANPCENSEFLSRAIEKLLDDQKRLSSLKLQIDGLVSLASTHPRDTESITALFGEIASRLGGSSVASAASLEISETRSIARTMLRG